MKPKSWSGWAVMDADGCIEGCIYKTRSKAREIVGDDSPSWMLRHPLRVIRVKVREVKP